MPGQVKIEDRHGQIDVERLYRLNGPAILAYIRRIVGDGEAARDLLQETFAQALKFPERIEAARSPRSWLFGVARRLALNSVRRSRRAGSLPADLGEAAPPTDKRLELVRDAIGQLPEPMRETLELRLTDELTYRQIAEVMGAPLGTVRSRIHQAVGRLRRSLTGEAK